jgi:hypothetical protein
MQKKEYIWIALLLLLAGLYLHFFTHWFAKGELVVTPSRRPAFGPNAAVESIVLTLNGPYKLKDLRVLELEDGKFNPHGHLLWHVISDSNSAPTQLIVYGRHIHGMKQAPDNLAPEPLQPDVGYRVVVSANNLTGSADFKTRAEQPN